MKTIEKSTYIIAEAGVNHNGDEKLAHELVRIAASAGADAVKFQLFSPKALAVKAAPTASYQAKNLNDNEISQQEMLEKLCLPEGAYIRLMASCKQHGINFICTPFDLGSLDYLLANTQMPYLKLSSGDVTNGVLLLAAARSGLPVILSTGMATLEEISAALCVIYFGYNNPAGFPTDLSTLTPQMLAYLRKKVTLLHCVSQYPAPVDITNLLAMDTMREKFGLPVGFSDHSLGIAIPTAAAARGAVIIEKHFTYDVKAVGPDHAASLPPEELRNMVSAIRAVEKAMGDGQKICQEQENNTKEVARRSVVAAAPIAKGEIFSEENLICKRPATGAIAPNSMWGLLGKAAKRAYAADEFISEVELE